MKLRHIGYLVIIVLLTGCAALRTTSSNQTQALQISSLKFLDEYEIPVDQQFDHTWVGGLSGIDYDPIRNRYFVISDERSQTSASRFYTATIGINDYKIDSVIFTEVATLKNPQNDTFTALRLLPEHAADPESVRFNPNNNRLVWSSEGDKAIRNGRMVLQHPSIYEMDLQGNFKDSFFMPPNLSMYIDDRGARENDALEGLSYTFDYQYLWASMEGAIYEDGPLANVDYANAPARFTKFDTKSRKAVAQYGYLLDAVADKPIPDSAFSVNGISENLFIGNEQFLVLERSYSTDFPNCVIKIYLADFSQATNVLNTASLYQNREYTPASKKLLFNLNTLNIHIDNVEGITLGPTLPNGRQSLLLIADNNFNELEKQQVFLFEILP